MGGEVIGVDGEVVGVDGEVVGGWRDDWGEVFGMHGSLFRCMGVSGEWDPE